MMALVWDRSLRIPAAAARKNLSQKRKEIKAPEKVFLFIEQTVIYIVLLPYVPTTEKRMKKIQTQDICMYTDTSIHST